MSKKISFFLLFFLLLMAIPALSSLASFDYTPMEAIPGFGKDGNFCNYITAVYKFGLWTIGICAMFMIMIGGYMYIMSAGNNAAMGKAKGIIFDAVVGLLLAFVSYLILYEINPDLVTIKSICGGGGTSTSSTSTSTTKPGTPTTPTPPAKLDCNSSDCPQINEAVKNNSYGVDPNILKSVLTGGEGCNKNISSDGHKSCGYGQVLPKYRAWCGITGTQEETCAKVQNDVNLDVNCAAKLIKEGNSKCNATDIAVVASCYNAGQPGKCAKTTNKYCDRVSNYLNNCTK